MVFTDRKSRSAVRPLTVLVAAVNFILFGVKLYLGIVSLSVCIYSDAVNNLFDSLSAVLAFFGTGFMKKKAPDSFPDGYSKAEHIIGLLMAIAVGITGVYFAYSSLERFLYPRPVNYLLRYAVILAAAALAKFLLGFVLMKFSKKEDSVILKTVYLDSFSDCGVTVMTLLSFVLTNYAGIRIDAVFGLAVSAVIIFNAVKLVKQSFVALLGKNDETLSAALVEEFGAHGITCVPVRVDKKSAQVRLSVDDAAAVKAVSKKLCLELYILTEEE